LKLYIGMVQATQIQWR